MPSTVIANMSYNKETQVLRVQFLSGLVYDYKNVEPELVRQMKAARSKGAFLNERIKNQYPYERVEEG